MKSHWEREQFRKTSEIQIEKGRKPLPFHLIPIIGYINHLRVLNIQMLKCREEEDIGLDLEYGEK